MRCPRYGPISAMADFTGHIRPAPQNHTLPAGFRIALSPDTRSWGGGSVLIGGAPWRISRVKAPVQDLVSRLRSAGSTGLELVTVSDLQTGRLLLDRGFAHPVRTESPPSPPFAVVIPAMDRADELAELLTSLPDQRSLVVDDASKDEQAMAGVADRYGARLIRHSVNLGPSAARNTGVSATNTPLVAFIDSDCLTDASWPNALLHHFDDPTVAAAAPRIVPRDSGSTILERFEETRSSLDMGRRPQLVKPGARLSFVPTAALIVRRAAFEGPFFNESLRLGEDVDLVWRLTSAGWSVRYDPTVSVGHRTRTDPRQWLTRRFEYGTSAAALDALHPGRLTPAHVSSWNLAALALIGSGRLPSAALLSMGAATLLYAEVRDLPEAASLSARTVGQGLLADAAAIGHLLRREWWPLGALSLALSPKSRIARTATACMLVPIALEWSRDRPRLDPVRYTLLRLTEDAAYGSGVITSSIRSRNPRPLIPHVRLPRLGRLARRPAPKLAATNRLTP